MTIDCAEQATHRRWSAGAAVAMGWIAWATFACAADAPVVDSPANALRQAWFANHDTSESTAFQEPIRVQSLQSSGALEGTLYAVVDRPFATFRSALADPVAWCRVLILDPNVHRCRVQPYGASAAATGVEVGFGRNDTAVAFAYRTVAQSPDYVHVRLGAATGPFGTRDYVIGFEAAALDATHTVVRLAFAQRFGLGARLAMLAYFNTVGRGKAGFSIVDRDAAGRPVYVSDLRGGLERNLVRYHFAILAYLDSLSAPGERQPEQRVRTWLAYTERYPLQLHEEAGYFERKSPDVRQQASDE
jgi:hypothetical protein